MSGPGIDSLSTVDTRRWRWRAALLLLVALPLVPEMVIIGTSLIAKIMGCTPEGGPCPIGPGSAAGLIRKALEAATFLGFQFSYGLAAVWLIMCYWLVARGWSSLRSRLLLAFALSIIFASVPYVGPLLSIDHLINPINPKCVLNEGGVGDCKIYGGDVAVAHDTERLAWRVMAGALIALGIFAVYAIMSHLRSKKRREQLARREQPLNTAD
jgi:hypothetical protein